MAVIFCRHDLSIKLLGCLNIDVTLFYAFECLHVDVDIMLFCLQARRQDFPPVRSPWDVGSQAEEIEARATRHVRLTNRITQAQTSVGAQNVVPRALSI